MTPQTNLAYAQGPQPTRTPRGAEYDVIARITQRLVAATARRVQDHPGFVRALSDNEILWSTLAADVAEPGNGLPAALRAKLFYLYEFTIQHGRTVRDGKGSAEVLIDINRAVLRGLRGDHA